MLNGVALGTSTPPVVPSVSIASATDTVTATGATSLAFTISLSQATTSTVTIGYATANGTAVAGTDYTSTSGTMTFAPGTTTQTFSVPVSSITQSGLASKTVLANLSNPAGQRCADPGDRHNRR